MTLSQRITRVTVVCPAYNEAAGIQTFYKTLTAELAELPARYRTDILFVVDGGTDGTFDIVREIAQKDPQVSIISFSRNFGHQMALLAGLDHASGDVVITMDSDLQHPPAVIPKLLEKYDEGNDVVMTIRTQSLGEPLVKRQSGRLFYRFFKIISDVPLQENAADFRLLSRRVVEVIRDNVRERKLFLRGLVSWVGFHQATVPFVAQPRFAGETHYPFRAMVAFAVLGAVSFSKKPLRLSTYVGVGIAAFGFLYAIVTILEYIVGVPLASGWPTLIVLTSIFSGTQLIFLGIIGEYIGMIFDEVKARPHYIVDQTVNVDAKTR